MNVLGKGLKKGEKIKNFFGVGETPNLGGSIFLKSVNTFLNEYAVSKRRLVGVGLFTFYIFT